MCLLLLAHPVCAAQEKYLRQYDDLYEVSHSALQPILRHVQSKEPVTECCSPPDTF